MHQDFYSSTFYSMRRKVKQDYNLLTTDTSEYYFESMFICGISNTFCLAYLVYDTDLSKVFNKANKNEFAVSLCIMFTVLVLHFSCV